MELLGRFEKEKAKIFPKCKIFHWFNLPGIKKATAKNFNPPFFTAKTSTDFQTLPLLTNL